MTIMEDVFNDIAVLNIQYADGIDPSKEYIVNKLLTGCVKQCEEE